jgi:hypothetical protein
MRNVNGAKREKKKRRKIILVILNRSNVKKIFVTDYSKTISALFEIKATNSCNFIVFK